MTNNNEKRIKVLFLAGWYPNEDNPISGVFIKRHAEAVSKYCEVGVLYIHHSKSRKKTDVEYSIEGNIKTIRVYPKSAQLGNRILRYLVNKLNQNICSYQGLKVVRKEFGRPDIIHVNVCLPMGILAVALDLFKGIPYIITEHYTGFSAQTKNPIYFIILKLILQRSKVICPVSNSLKQSMESFYPSDNYQVIPNVINTDFFSPRPSKSVMAKKQMLHISTLKDQQKNISGIFYAILELTRIRNDFELHLIGDGNDRQYLEKLAIQMGIKDKFIFFYGFVSDLELREYLRNSDFFILNSNYETFSVSCTEALASGIPVISTRCGGPENYINSDVGIIIEKGNTKELIQVINYMLDNSGKYDPKILHEYAKNRFGYDVVGKQFFNIYTSIITKWKVGQGRHIISIEKDWIVGDIGSGHHPHRRADILLDRELGTTPDRSGAKAVVPKDKAFLLADVSKGLPLKKKDLIIPLHLILQNMLMTLRCSV